jgi:hypothetical protein
MNITPVPAILPVDFYVYEHRKATTGEVFYVGKGKGGRAWQRSCRNSHWDRTAKKHGVLVCVLISGLQEWAAHEIEMQQIALHGRLNDGFGPLVNKTDGGEGTSGAYPGPETRAKISKAGLGKKRSIETRQAISLALKGKPKSEQHRAALSELKAGKKQGPRPPEWRAAISAGQTGVKRGPMRKDAADQFREAVGCRVVLCVETGQQFWGCGQAAKWASEKTGKKAWRQSIRQACESGGRLHLGFTWRYA